MSDQKKSTQQTYSSNQGRTRIILDPTHGTANGESKEGEGERTMFRAVVYQALLDASHLEPTSKEFTQVKEEAVRWFSKTTGVTASWFVDVCDLAGLNYQQVRTFAKKLIVDPENTEFQRKRLNVLLNMKTVDEVIDD